MQRLPELARQAYPWALAAVLASMFAFPGTLAPAAVTLTGLLGGGALAALSLFAPARPLPRPLTAFLLALLPLLGWLALTSALAHEPRISFVGAIALHQGTALWAAGAAWLVAGVLLADARMVRALVSVLAAAGGVFVVAALVAGPAPGSVEPSGVFENSASLGGFLAIALVAAAVLTVGTRRPGVKAAGAALALACVAGIALADSRTGILGVLCAAVFAGALRFTRERRAAPALALGSAIAATGASALLALGAAGRLGEGFAEAIGALGSGRDAVWRPVLAQIGQSPIVGSGLEQFTGWIRWSVVGQEVQTGRLTFDPHNVPLGVVLGGGAAGGLLLFAAFTALVWACSALLRRGGVAGALLAATPAALMGVGLVGWIAPAAMVAACAMTGAALGAAATRHPGSERAATPDAEPARVAAPGRAVAAATAALALALGVAAVPALSTQRAYAEMTREGAPAPAPERVVALYDRWPDPAFAVVALDRLWPAVASGDQRARLAAERLMDETTDVVAWRADLALLHLDTARALQTGRPERFPAFAELVEASRASDPSSGIWDAIAALEAERLGLAEEATRAAARALEFDLDEAARAELERLAR